MYEQDDRCVQGVPPIDTSLFYKFCSSHKHELVQHSSYKSQTSYRYLLSKMLWIVKAKTDGTKSRLSEAKFLVPD
jgi:hypothetical protein